MTQLILKIAKCNRDGFTYDLRLKKLIIGGFVSAYDATQNSFETTDLENVINHAQQHDNVVGGWYDSETGLFYFDSCKVFDNLDDAISFGKAQNQIAIYDLDKLIEVRL
jgi:hypothetical protein